MIRKFCIWYLRITETPVLMNLKTTDAPIVLSAKKGPIYMSADTGAYDVKVNYRSKAKVLRHD